MAMFSDPNAGDSLDVGPPRARARGAGSDPATETPGQRQTLRFLCRWWCSVTFYPTGSAVRSQVQESKYCPALKSESRGSLAGCLPVQLAWPLSLSACNAWRHCGLAGLRRNEIDKLPWSAFRWDEGVIRIERTDGDGT